MRGRLRRAAAARPRRAEGPAPGRAPALPATTIRAGETSVAQQLGLVLGQRARDHELEPRGDVGVVAGQLAERLDQRPRVAPVAAEAAGVDERDALGIEQPGRRRPAVPASDSGRGPSRSGRAAGRCPGARAGPRRPGRLTQTTASAERRASGAPGARRGGAGAPVGKGGPQRLEGPGVADVGDPGDAAALQRAADRVRRLGRRGRDHAVERLAAVEPQRARARANGAQAATSGSGTSSLLSGCGLPE